MTAGDALESDVAVPVPTLSRAELISVLEGASLEDVVVVGYAEVSESNVRFRPLPRALFLQLGTGTVRLLAAPSGGRFTLSLVDRVSLDGCDFTLDGDRPAEASLGFVLLDEPDGENRVVSAVAWDLATTHEGLGCAALKLVLGNGQVLFFDPWTYFGGRVGGTDRERLCRESYLGVESLEQSLFERRE